MPKQSDDLSRKDDPSQETEQAKLKIPVPKRGDFDRLLARVRKLPPDRSKKSK